MSGLRGSGGLRQRLCQQERLIIGARFSEGEQGHGELARDRDDRALFGGLAAAGGDAFAGRAEGARRAEGAEDI